MGSKQYQLGQGREKFTMDRHLCFSTLLGVCAFSSLAAVAQLTEWVERGESDRLIYLMDGEGDRIMDFSLAGYKNGAPLPAVNDIVPPGQVVNVSPVAGDDTSTIQAAVNSVAALPVGPSGYRGVVQLSAGEFQIDSQITINTGGIVLRGVDDGASAATSTILRATGTEQRTLISTGSNGSSALTPISNTTSAITDKVVPAGAISVSVSNPQLYNVGDSVVVRRDASQEWITSLGGPSAMWDPTDVRFDQLQERKITAIDQDRIFLDAPVANSIDSRDSSGTVYKYTDQRIENLGIENIRGVSDYDAAEVSSYAGQTIYTDEDHADTFIAMSRVKNGFVRNVTAEHFIEAAVRVNGVAKNITVENAKSLAPVSTIDGSRRYAFDMNGGQFILMKDLYSEQGRHDFVNNSTAGGYNRGPNVFYNAQAVDGLNDIGPHQKYATGTLFDTISAESKINVRDRGDFGTQHGWTGANFVVWNSTAPGFLVQNPPGAQNWLIGATGGGITSNDAPNGAEGSGYVDSLGNKVRLSPDAGASESLFVAQVAERTGRPAQLREYWLGDFDSYENDGADDSPPADADWVAATNSLFAGAGVAGLDSSTGSLRKIPATFVFSLAPNQELIAAVLTIAMKKTGSGGASDAVYIDGTGAASRFLISYFGTLPSFNGSEILQIEFDATGGPALSLLDDGQLNLLIGDDRAVDWIDLQMALTPPAVSAIPEPGILSILLGSAMMLRRKR